MQPDATCCDADLLRLTLPEPGIAHLVLNRVAKRNAISDPLVASIRHAFSSLSDDIELLCSVGQVSIAALDWAFLSYLSAALRRVLHTPARGMRRSIRCSSAVLR